MEIYALVDGLDCQTICVSDSIRYIHDAYDKKVSESDNPTQYPILEIWRDGEILHCVTTDSEMKNFFFYKSPITKEMIKRGFDNGKIRIICSDSEIQCKIQDNSFVFLSEFMSLEEFWNKFQEPTIRSMIYEILKDPEVAELYGIDVDEWEYYKLVLSK